jgi:hypothetical protein
MKKSISVEEETETSVCVPKANVSHRKALIYNAADLNNKETESHQYDQDESEVWWHHQLQRYNYLFCKV